MNRVILDYNFEYVFILTTLSDELQFSKTVCGLALDNYDIIILREVKGNQLSIDVDTMLLSPHLSKPLV